MDCLLPAVFAALSGGDVADARMIAPPTQLNGRPTRRAEGKAVYGENMAYHVDGTHFTVQWEDPSIDTARAEAILAQLDAAWEVLVEVDGWPAPASSDAYLLWFILDPTLCGSGYTTVYRTDDYPSGYPVSFVNPDYGLPDEPDYALSVGVHEFGHGLQYGLRAWTSDDENQWYWEATSEWVAEHAAPELDTYAISSYFYAYAPEEAVTSTEGGHQYGMLVLNAYLDEVVFGFEGILDVWTAEPGGARAWDELIAERAGQDFGALVADMAAHVGAGVLRESSLYYEPVRVATHRSPPEAETMDLAGKFGSHFVDLRGDAPGFYAEGDVLVSYFRDGEVLPEAPAEGAYTAVLTSLKRSGEVTYGARDVPDDTGEDTDPDQEGDDPEGVGEDDAAACGCASGAGRPAGAWVLAGAMVALVVTRRGLRGRGSRPRGAAAAEAWVPGRSDGGSVRRKM